MSAQGSGLLLRALLLKVLFAGLLLAIAAHWPSDSAYLAPREGQANDVVWTLARGFDANAYQRLSREGYYDDFSRNYPLGYPLLIGAFDALVDNTQTAAVLATNTSALLAVLLFALVARAYAGRARRRGWLLPEARLSAASWLFMATPGWLVFGTVAYSEGTWLALSLAAWWAYLRAERWTVPTAAAVASTLAEQREEQVTASLAGDCRGIAPAPAPAAQPGPIAGLVSPNRSLAWLALFGLLAGASVMVRHAGASFLLAVAGMEAWRVLAVRGAARRRVVLEAALACWSVLPVAAYFAWKYGAHDLAGLQQRIWHMGFSPLGGLASLISAGAAPEYLAQIYATLPICIWLLWRARRLDPRLTVLGLVSLFVMLSYTGTAAQSLMRYMWALWPAPLAALTLRDRGLVFALAAMLFCLSLMIGAGHVLGTAAL